MDKDKLGQYGKILIFKKDTYMISPHLFAVKERKAYLKYISSSAACFFPMAPPASLMDPPPPPPFPAPFPSSPS